MTSTAALTWQVIGKDAHQAKVTNGFMHVIKVGGNVWSVTLNGRVIGTAKTADAAKAIAANGAN